MPRSLEKRLVGLRSKQIILNRQQQSLDLQRRTLETQCLRDSAMVLLAVSDVLEVQAALNVAAGSLRGLALAVLESTRPDEEGRIPGQDLQPVVLSDQAIASWLSHADTVLTTVQGIEFPNVEDFKPLRDPLFRAALAARAQDPALLLDCVARVVEYTLAIFTEPAADLPT